MPRDVLLLRSPSEDPSGGPDKYEAAFRARGYRALSVPVLETVYVNADDLLSVVRAGGRIQHNEHERYAGMIVTSGRACEAWQAAVQRLASTHASNDGEEGWSSIPFYAVGQATASALSAIHTAQPSSPYTPHDVRGGAQSGTAEKLAHFIVSDLSSSTEARRRLLYLTGDKNRDVLSNILVEANFELEDLQVYATQGSSRFEDDLRNALDGVQALDRTDHWWIVHFAPSSAKHVFPILHSQAIIAAIGPTTSAFLEEELNVKVNVVPARPTPDALVEDIVRWDKEHGF